MAKEIHIPDDDEVARDIITAIVRAQGLSNRDLHEEE